MTEEHETENGFEDFENLSPEELQERIQKEKKNARRSLRFAFTALVAIIAVCIAWFVSNTQVSGTLGTITANMRSVELGTCGGAGIHDDLLKKTMNADDSQNSFWYELADKAKGFLETSSDKYAINWLLSDTSNMGNYSTEQSDWEAYWKNPPQGVERQDKAIEPGSYGRLAFYAVPKYDGEIELNMNLSLIPYKAEGSELKEITEETDKVAKDFIDGHILFFLESGTENNKEIQWIKNGTFHITIKDAKKDQKYGYTLYWCWAQSFAETVLKKKDRYLNERNTLFSEFKNGEEMRKTILQTEDLSMVKKPERYFFSNLTKNPLSADQKELNEITNMYNKSSAELSETAKNAFVDLSSYYNQADQYIGSHVDCVRVRLTAE